MKTLPFPARGTNRARALLVSTALATVAAVLCGGAASAAIPSSARLLAVDDAMSTAYYSTGSSGTRAAAGAADGAGPAAASSALSVADLKVMNYYPSDAGWTSMWSRYSHATIDTDFAAIKSLGANTVRVIVQPSAVGWPNVSSTARSHFVDLMTTAANRGLHVQLSLFDWWGSYTGISGSKSWLNQLLAGYQNKKQIALVELQNEIDPANPTAMAWARQMLAYLPTVLPNVARTMSVPGSLGLAGVSKMLGQLSAGTLDVVDLHLYGTWTTVIDILSKARSVAGGRPVFIGETGRAATSRTNAQTGVQAQYYENLAALCRYYGYGVPSPWTLNDFTANGIPPGRVSHRPDEPYYGLRYTDGSWKPAATSVRTMFSVEHSVLPATANSRRSVAEFGPHLDAGFEREDARAGSNNALGSWSVINATAATLIGTVAGKGRSGQAAVIRGATGSSPVPAIYQSVPLMGVHNVKATIWTSLVSAKGGTRIALAWFGPSGFIAQNESALASVKVAGWQALTISGTAPAGATIVQIHLKSSSNPGTAYFDDLVVTAS